MNILHTTYLSTKSTEQSVPEVTQREREVLVEEIPQKLTHPVITPSAVDQKKSLQVSKLSNRVIACQNCLQTFLA